MPVAAQTSPKRAVARSRTQILARAASYAAREERDADYRFKRVKGSPEWYRRMSIHPHSQKRIAWDTVSMFFLFYNAFIVPLRLTFDVTDYCPTPIWFFEAFTDLFFVRKGTRLESPQSRSPACPCMVLTDCCGGCVPPRADHRFILQLFYGGDGRGACGWIISRCYCATCTRREGLLQILVRPGLLLLAPHRPNLQPLRLRLQR